MTGEDANYPHPCASSRNHLLTIFCGSFLGFMGFDPPLQTAELSKRLKCTTLQVSGGLYMCSSFFGILIHKFQSPHLSATLISTFPQCAWLALFGFPSLYWGCTHLHKTLQLVPYGLKFSHVKTPRDKKKLGSVVFILWPWIS